MQDGAELAPTFNWPAERTLFLIAGGEAALIRPAEGAEDSTELPDLPGAPIGPTDVLIAVAASGVTPFTVACAKVAAATGALTVGFANNAGSPLLAEVDHKVLLPTAPEPVAGSTRLGAGTAQKVALNIFSTALMVRLGRVYRGRMVEMRPTNAKLVARSERMVADLAGVHPEAARLALLEANGDIKLAILLLEGLSRETAEALLEANNGDLRSTLRHMR